jgi:ABC-type Zn uptake system ZnuABC Zn-binding protein ZnuA
MIQRPALLLILLALGISACQPGAASIPSTGPVIVASTTVLADMARNVTGSEVDSLLPPGTDPHEYQASPADVQKIAKSSVLIVNGLEYERFIEPLVENAGGERLTITASQGLEVRQLVDETGKTTADPHMWLDPLRVIRYVENIRDGLSSSYPRNAALYKKNADVYISQLEALDAWIREQVDAIPANRRLLVTNHDSMGYFADRYGFTVVTRIIPSLSTEAGTSARDLAAAIDQIRAAGAVAVFVGQLENRKLADQIAAETGAVVVDDLYLESLSKGPPAGTYIDMMKHNVERIVQVLR